jgi:uncharacterized membrane-anchored protein YjiN (DUF445 family)
VRTIAMMLLVLMSAIYLAVRRAPASWVWAPYLGAFAEAGMVGACADWFAVVALFRRPFGLPIPHTAVVPENKRRIGAAMGRFITNNFLSPRVAIARLSSVDFAGLAARWLEDEGSARAAASALRALARSSRGVTSNITCQRRNPALNSRRKLQVPTTAIPIRPQVAPTPQSAKAS